MSGGSASGCRRLPGRAGSDLLDHRHGPRIGRVLLHGHVSIQTTERYLGCKQKLRCAVNDRLGMEADELDRAWGQVRDQACATTQGRCLGLVLEVVLERNGRH